MMRAGDDKLTTDFHAPKGQDTILLFFLKVNFQPVNTDRGAHLPLEANWARLIFRCMGTLHLLHNEPVTFPALPVPIYTPGWRGVIMVKCLTQGHNTLTVMGLEPTTFCL